MMFSGIGIKKMFLFFVVFISLATLCAGIFSFFTSGQAVDNLTKITQDGLGSVISKNEILKNLALLHSNVLATSAETNVDARMLRVEIVDAYFKELNESMKKCAECATFEGKIKNYYDHWTKLKSDFLSKDSNIQSVQYTVEHAVPLAEAIFDDLDKTLAKTTKSTTATAKEEIKKSETMRYYFLSSLFFSTLLILLSGLYFRKILVASINKMTADLQNSTLETSSLAEDLISTSQKLSHSATRQASSVEETSASLQEISTMIQLNAKSAQEASTLALESSDIAKKGGVEITNLIGCMRLISESSKKIEEIIGVIDDISFQTNLLALNAAVEAARAGEQGRGFAIVADAVRSLAHRSAESAKEIGQLIGANVTQAETGRKIADSSGEALSNIISSIEKMTSLNHEMASSSLEQSRGIQQLEQAMLDINQVVQSNSLVSSDVSGSATRLLEQAASLASETNALKTLLIGSWSNKLDNNSRSENKSLVSSSSSQSNSVPKKVA